MLSFDLKEYSSFTQFWPFIVLVIVAFALISKRGGLRIIRAFKAVDERVVAGLKWITWLPGAYWSHPNEDERTAANVLRWIWFVAFFGLIFIGSVGMVYWVDNWPSAARFGCIAMGYVVALAIGRTWVSAQAEVLDQQEVGAEGGLAHRLRLRAMISFLFLLLLVPISFDATANSELGWFEDRSFLEWGLVTVHLLFRAAVDFIEILNTGKESGIEFTYDGIGEGALVLLHFLTLGYVVVTGITLLARGDHAMHGDVSRLKKSSNNTNIFLVVRHGERVIPDLLQLLKGNPRSEEARGAVTALGLIHERFKGRGKKSFEALEKLATAKEEWSKDLSKRLFVSIAKWNNAEAADLLLNKLHASKGGDLSPVIVDALVSMKLESKSLVRLIEIAHRSSADENTIPMRQAIAEALVEDSELLAAPRVSKALEDTWLQSEGSEPVPKIRNTLLRALEQSKASNRNKLIAEGFAGLASTDPQQWERGLIQLRSHVTQPSVRDRLLSEYVRVTDKPTYIRSKVIGLLAREDLQMNSTYESTVAPSLRERLRTPDGKEHVLVKLASARGLTHIQNSKQLAITVRLLEGLAENETNPDVKFGVHGTLNRLGHLTAQDISTFLLSVMDQVEAAKAKAKAAQPLSGAGDAEVDQEIVKEVHEVIKELVKSFVALRQAGNPDLPEAQSQEFQSLIEPEEDQP